MHRRVFFVERRGGSQGQKVSRAFFRRGPAAMTACEALLRVFSRRRDGGHAAWGGRARGVVDRGSDLGRGNAEPNLRRHHESPAGARPSEFSVGSAPVWAAALVDTRCCNLPRVSGERSPRARSGGGNRIGASCVGEPPCCLGVDQRDGVRPRKLPRSRSAPRASFCRRSGQGASLHDVRPWQARPAPGRSESGRQALREAHRHLVASRVRPRHGSPTPKGEVSSPFAKEEAGLSHRASGLLTLDVARRRTNRRNRVSPSARAPVSRRSLEAGRPRKDWRDLRGAVLVVDSDGAQRA